MEPEGHWVALLHALGDARVIAFAGTTDEELDTFAAEFTEGLPADVPMIAEMILQLLRLRNLARNTR